MASENPLLDTVLNMTAASVENTSLEDRELMLVRIAALAAVDAPAGSYLLNLGAAAESGVSAEDVQGVLVAVAPVIGAPTVVKAARNIADALGLAVAIDDSLSEG
jgi:alkylhydroperoxidase/carboxymuconolactone decarboxylase family protein YurZ